MIDIIKKLLFKKKTLFSQNITDGTKLERFDRYLSEKSGMNWNLNRDKNNIILFHFLNRYETIRSKPKTKPTTLS